MKEKTKTFLIELCCVYTAVSVIGAIVNMLAGTQTNNLNVIVMFATCLIATFILYLHRLFDRISPLLMIIIQYLVACGLCAVMLLVIGHIVGEPVSAKGWFEYYRSFTIPYIFLAGFYYFRVFRETKKQDALIHKIQQQKKAAVSDQQEFVSGSSQE